MLVDLEVVDCVEEASGPGLAVFGPVIGAGWLLDVLELASDDGLDGSAHAVP